MTMFNLNYYTQMVVTRNNYENYGIDFYNGTFILKGFYSLDIMETSRWGPYFFVSNHGDDLFYEYEQDVMGIKIKFSLFLK